MLNDFADEDWSLNRSSAYGTTTPNAANGGFFLRKVPHLLRMLHAQPFHELVKERDPGTQNNCFSTSIRKLNRTKWPIGAEAIRFGVPVTLAR